MWWTITTHIVTVIITWIAAWWYYEKNDRPKVRGHSPKREKGKPGARFP